LLEVTALAAVHSWLGPVHRLALAVVECLRYGTAWNYPGEGTMQLARSPAAPVKHLQIASRARGFTLVELMVTIAVLAILAAIAFPSFRSLINSSRLSSGANELIATMQLAKAEAVRQNGRVTICASTNGSACSGSNDWHRIIVLVDSDKSVVRDVELPATLRVLASPAISDASNSIMVTADGLARPGSNRYALLKGKVRVCIAGTVPKENTRDIAISGSRVSVDRPALQIASCAAPAN
jgi:type IV fimbrial biogenesis protein FimT